MQADPGSRPNHWGCHEQSHKVGDTDAAVTLTFVWAKRRFYAPTVSTSYWLAAGLRICRSEIIDGTALADLSLVSLAARESKYLKAGCIDHPSEGGLHQSFFYKLVYSYNLLHPILDCARQTFCTILANFAVAAFILPVKVDYTNPSSCDSSIHAICRRNPWYMYQAHKTSISRPQDKYTRPTNCKCKLVFPTLKLKLPLIIPVEVNYSHSLSYSVHS